uniref:Cytochrome P450 CYP3026A3 n=2 Tax=Tigriopus japonicus TaxID=158387 RepID=A0A088DIA6_TIGJA|nr:cytochrome P450 CYP3026A3 [Tigriopus japonicus]
MIFELIIGVLCIIGYFYIRLKIKWNFWKDHNVPFPQPEFPFGSTPMFGWNSFKQEASMNDLAKTQAMALGFPKFYGNYIFGAPNLMICDPEMAKQIMVKDFDHFVNRQAEDFIKLLEGGHFVDQVWANQMTALQGDKWKNTRATFTPIFTAGKLKGMIKFMHEVTNDLVKSVDQEAKTGKAFDLKEKFGKFSMDTIATCAFGVNAKSFEDDKSTFAMNARAVFRNSRWDVLRIIMALLPGGKEFLNFFGSPINKKHVTLFFYDIIRGTIEHRMKTKTRRNDLVDLMIDAMKADTPPEEDKDTEGQFDQDAKLNHKVVSKQMDEITMVATALVILVAGYDTTAQTMAITSYFLARNPDIQEKLYQEIMECVGEIKNEKGHPDYNQIQSLPYLDMVLHETLRINPALGIITRVCSKDYLIPGTDVLLKKGNEVHINAMAIHNNPNIYPDPEKYDPERFTKEAKANRHPYAFLGFGQGPRNCIGMRFALLEAKLGLFAVLWKYKFVATTETVEEFTLDPSSFLSAPKEALFVKVEERQQ